LNAFPKLIDELPPKLEPLSIEAQKEIIFEIKLVKKEEENREVERQALIKYTDPIGVRNFFKFSRF